MNFIETFTALLMALIVKDFYNIFVRNHIMNIFGKYREMYIKGKDVIKNDKRNKKI